MTQALTERYADGMTRYLNANGIRIFDYPESATTLRERMPWHARPGSGRRSFDGVVDGSVRR